MKEYKTEYGLIFIKATEIPAGLNEYDKMIAETQLRNFGVIYLDFYDRKPIDNEYDIEYIRNHSELR